MLVEHSLPDRVQRPIVLQELADLTVVGHHVPQTVVLERGSEHVALPSEKLNAFEEPLNPVEHLQAFYHLLVVERLELQLLEGLQVRLREQLVLDGLRALLEAFHVLAQFVQGALS